MPPLPEAVTDQELLRVRVHGEDVLLARHWAVRLTQRPDRLQGVTPGTLFVVDLCAATITAATERPTTR